MKLSAHMRRSACLLLCMLSLTACSGFHLRGADSPTLIALRGKTVQVLGVDTRQDFGAVLAKTLRERGAELVTGSDTVAGLQLGIDRFQEGKTVSAYSAVRQVREFNHFIEVGYSVRRGSDASDTPAVSATVRAERIQIYDSRYVLGVAEEERIIREELRARAAHLLAVRLGAF